MGLQYRCTQDRSRRIRTSATMNKLKFNFKLPLKVMRVTLLVHNKHGESFIIYYGKKLKSRLDQEYDCCVFATHQVLLSED